MKVKNKKFYLPIFEILQTKLSNIFIFARQNFNYCLFYVSITQNSDFTSDFIYVMVRFDMSIVSVFL